MKYNINMNFALEIAQNSNGVTILKKSIDVKGQINLH